MAELRRVYDGSGIANDAAPRVGEDVVQETLRAVSETRVAGEVIQEEQRLKWLSTDTTPTEALIFDKYSRRMANKEISGKWNRVDALENYKTRGDIVKIYNELFERNSETAWRIDAGSKDIAMQMKKFRDGIFERKNIAFVEVINLSGKKTIYVSVSGGKNLTKDLPLFKIADKLAQGWVEREGVKYINVDHNQVFSSDPIGMDSNSGVPRSLPDVGDNPVSTRSLDTESKLLQYISNDSKGAIKSSRIFTLLEPCNSCAVVLEMYTSTQKLCDLTVYWALEYGKDTERSHEPGASGH